MPFVTCKDCGFVAPLRAEDGFDPNDTYQCEACYWEAYQKYMATLKYEPAMRSHKEYAIHPTLKGCGWKYFCLKGLLMHAEDTAPWMVTEG